MQQATLIFSNSQRSSFLLKNHRSSDIVLCKDDVLLQGIVDFGTVTEEHIREALPFLKSQGVVYYVHAEKVDATKFQV